MTNYSRNIDLMFGHIFFFGGGFSWLEPSTGGPLNHCTTLEIVASFCTPPLTWRYLFVWLASKHLSTSTWCDDRRNWDALKSKHRWRSRGGWKPGNLLFEQSIGNSLKKYIHLVKLFVWLAFSCPPQMNLLCRLLFWTYFTFEPIK